MKKLLGPGALLGLVLVAAALIHYQTGRVWNVFTWASAGAGAALLAAFAVFRFEDVRRAVSLRSFRYGGNALALSLMVFAALGLLNFMANRHSLRADLSRGGQFSVAPQTRSVLKGLKREVRVLAFFKAETQKPVEDLLKTYRFYSDRFQYEFIDPDKKPAVAKMYGVTAYETLVFESGTHTQKITEKDEQALTNALIQVTREGKKVVVFLDGHGEADIEGTDKTGYSLAKKAVTDERYEVRKLNLAAEKRVPDDCTVLVAAGPQKALFPSEFDSVDAYLNRGGKVLFLVDPEVSGFGPYFARWGLSLGDNVVLDVSGMGQLFGMGPWVPLVSTYTGHAITEKFRVMTFFPYCRSVTPASPAPRGLTVERLIETTSNSWGETDIKNPRAGFNEGRDLAGPVSLAAVVTPDSSVARGRLIVFGDSDFAGNTYFGVQGNGDLFLNTVSWLAEEKDLISIRAKQPEDRRVFLTAKQARWVWIVAVVLMPLAAVGAAVWTYIRRERRSK